jgi:MFS family permease
MSERRAAGEPAFRPGLAFAGIFAVTFCGLFAVGAVLPVLPRYVHGPLDGGNIAVGIVVGSYAATGLLLRPVAGRYADRKGRRPTVLVGSLLVALSGFLYLLPLGVAGLIAARLVLGAGEGTVFTAGSAWIVDLAPEDRRGRVIGLYGLAIWAALSIGPLVGELLLHASGYTAVWLFAGGVPLVGTAIALRVPDPYRPHPSLEEEHHPLIAREAVRPGAALALGSIGYACVAAFVVLHLDARDVGHGAAVFGAFATMVVLTRLVAGDLPDRVGPARVATGAALAEAVGLVTIGVAQSLPVAIVGALAMGTAFSLLYPSLSLIVVERIPETRRGAALGTFTAFFDAGVGLGAPLAGAAAALTSYQGAFLLSAAIALVAATMIAVAIAGQGRPLAQRRAEAG